MECSLTGAATTTFPANLPGKKPCTGRSDETLTRPGTLLLGWALTPALRSTPIDVRRRFHILARMFDVIRDFLLVPALLTTGLLSLPAMLLGLLARAMARSAGATPRGWGAWGLALLLGLVGTLASILILFALSVVRGIEDLQLVAWPVAGLGWWLSWHGVARLGRYAAWAALVVATLAWGLDTWVTSAILFE